MTTIPLNMFGTELNQPVFATGIAPQLTAESRLDFSGITSVSAPFLDALFAKLDPELIADVLINYEAVEDSIANWLTHSDTQPIETLPPQVAVPDYGAESNSAPDQLVYHQEVDTERYTPGRLLERLKTNLTRYLESAYPLNDAILMRSRRHLLENHDNGRLLAQEAYVETTPRYEVFSGDYHDLNLPGDLGGYYAGLAKKRPQYSPPDSGDTLLYPQFYLHQSKAFQSFLVENKDIIVATGTGSGKTECFLVPLLGHLYLEAQQRPESFQKPGVRALILYPMNALVNDQLSRLRLLFGDPAVGEAFPLRDGYRRPNFGMYTGRTLYPGARKAGRDGSNVAPLLEYYLNLDDELEGKLRSLGRYPAKDLKSFYASYHEEDKTDKNGKAYKKRHWEKRLHTGKDDAELLTRHEMVHGSGARPGHAPDILVTNYSMLEYMLMRPFERPIFDETRQWIQQEGNEFLLILDEAHMYRGSQGAEVGCLIRRLTARLGIQDQPEKLRVIATSASLSKTDKALEEVKAFAADLTGKKPDDFVTVTGTRVAPGKPGTGANDLAEILAEIPMDALHAESDLNTLVLALHPLFAHANHDLPEHSEDESLAALYRLLSTLPVVHQLMEAASHHAQSMSQLAEKLFPESEQALKATETLLSLGTLARKGADQPGLIPTRLHAFFRGLQGIFACVNPTCKGRQNSPGVKAPVGKLFASARTHCDACQSRVLELASCRACGAPYFFAYTNDSIIELKFLWSEIEGVSEQVDLLCTPPQYPQNAEPIHVHMPTGYLVSEKEKDHESVRTFWIALTSEGERSFRFKSCPSCQKTSGNFRPRILDFRTRGEQPFTSLIDTQFAEQPPQKSDERLPNRGRKVLVFSDGRQKAARLAPALEHSHSRDLFRQVLAMTVEKLKSVNMNNSLDDLYPALVWISAHHGFNLFPSPDEAEFKRHYDKAKTGSFEKIMSPATARQFRPIKSYAQALYSEMTDRYYSLASLAIGRVQIADSVLSELPAFPGVGVSQQEAYTLLYFWVRLLMENRCFNPTGADTDEMTEEYDFPKGISPEKVKQIFPQQFEDYLGQFLREKSGSANTDEVIKWFQKIIRYNSIEGSLFEFVNDEYFLSVGGLKLELELNLENVWWNCSACGRFFAENQIEICPACSGQLKKAEPDYLQNRTGFYRDQIKTVLGGRVPFSLTTAEHSAQLNSANLEGAYNRTEEYELRFQDIPIRHHKSNQQLEPIDVLSCTTTMEVGIDIGSLCGVALRNVPPLVANYQQRAGRAGRRGRSVASVVTYAHGTSHDAHYFQHPDKIISGEVLSPIVYIENQKILERHINAYLIQRFFHENVGYQSNDKHDLFSSLGHVEGFLDPLNPCSFEKLKHWLQQNTISLEAELKNWVPQYSQARQSDIPNIENTIDCAIPYLLKSLEKVLPFEAYAKREELPELEREGLEKVLQDELLTTLLNRAVLPRYAFPTDTVQFWVSERKHAGQDTHLRKFRYEPQRDLKIALTEFAPGSSLTIDKWRFKSAALYSPYDPDIDKVLSKSHSYFECKECNYVSLKQEHQNLIECPCCESRELIKQCFITPKGFAPDINAKDEVDRGQGSSYMGFSTRAQLEVQEPPKQWNEVYSQRLLHHASPQDLVVVNKGWDNGGFNLCSKCGRIEGAQGPKNPNSTLFKKGVPKIHKHPLEFNQTCSGDSISTLFMGHQFRTDVLLLKLCLESPFICSTQADANTSASVNNAGRKALTSMVEALCLSASQTLQIEEGELGGNWTPIPGASSEEVYIFLHDLLPGGAGYTLLIQEHLEEVMEAAEQLLQNCDCVSSCYKCLRHYGNNFYHASLDRHLALALIKHLRTGEIPSLSDSEKTQSLHALLEYLDLRRVPHQQGVEESGMHIPLVILPGEPEETWVDVHHPLFDIESEPPALDEEAMLSGKCFVSIDSHMLNHNLPIVFDKDLKAVMEHIKLTQEALNV